MPRPCASPENRALGVLFAKAITVDVPCEKHPCTVPRSGEHSIFDVFKRCFRRSVSDNSRNGLSELEMNQALQKSGFRRVRIRKAASKKFVHDGSARSFFRFSARRFRDPDNFQDLEFLQSVWQQVNKHAPVACPLQVLLPCLREANNSAPQPLAHASMVARRKQACEGQVQQPGMNASWYLPLSFKQEKGLVQQQQDCFMGQAITPVSTLQTSSPPSHESEDSKEDIGGEKTSKQVPQPLQTHPMIDALPKRSNQQYAPAVPFPAHAMDNLQMSTSPAAAPHWYRASSMQPWHQQAVQGKPQPAFTPVQVKREPACADAWEVVQCEGLCLAELDAFLEEAGFSNPPTAFETPESSKAPARSKAPRPRARKKAPRVQVAHPALPHRDLAFFHPLF